MPKQQTIEFFQPDSPSQSADSAQPTALPGHPLQLEELLSLIKSAHDHGYTIKDARDMKSLYDVVSSDLYSIWYAIENEVSLFAHNVLDLIEFTGWKRHKKQTGEEEETEMDLAVAS